MQTKIIDRLSPDLDEVALDSPRATFYHTGVWLDSIAHTYPGMKLRCIVAEDGIRVIGFLPFFDIRRGPTRTLWSLPFGTYGGPVVRAVEANAGVEQRLLAEYLSMRRGLGVIEIGLVDYSNVVPKGVFSFDTSSTHVLDLGGGFEEVWKNRFDKSKRRQARKAKREGLS
ncbi:MAG: hypothetical protein JSW50_06475, partial [Candidatus Latescibacterota bacterium]